MTRSPAAGAWVSESIERLRATRWTGRTLAGISLLVAILAIAAIGLAGGAPSGPSPSGADGPSSFVDPATAGDAGSGAPVPSFGGPLDTGLSGIIDLAGKAILVLALLVLTLRLLNHLSSAGGSAAAHLVILESRPLAQRASLHLVAVGERRLVIGLTPGGLVPLAELAADELPEPAIEDGSDRSAFVADVPGSGPIGRFARAAADLARHGGPAR